MVLALAKHYKKKPTWPYLSYAIKRNFGGLAEIDPLQMFEKHLHQYTRTYKVSVFCYVFAY